MVRKWTDEQKAEQARKISAWKPWTRATGPKSDAGKARSAKNNEKRKAIAGRPFKFTKSICYLMERDKRDGLSYREIGLKYGACGVTIRRALEKNSFTERSKEDIGEVIHIEKNIKDERYNLRDLISEISCEIRILENKLEEKRGLLKLLTARYKLMEKKLRTVINKKNKIKNVENISDGYAAKLMGVNKEDVTIEALEVKRLVLQLKREKKKWKK
jgi:predicted ribosome quality control (RQC) complex YloA/Tae2 family protein